MTTFPTFVRQLCMPGQIPPLSAYFPTPAIRGPDPRVAARTQTAALRGPTADGFDPSPYLKLQEVLAEARRALGKAQLAKRPTLTLQSTVDGLDSAERAQMTRAPAEVQKARLSVFITQFRALERADGPKVAVRAARNVYFTGKMWAAASGTKAFSPAQINATGLPHDAQHNEAFGNDGFRGKMRLADGRLFDMGHLMAVLDWTLNADRHPTLMKLPHLPLPVPNLVDVQTVGLQGDLGTSVTDYSQKRDHETAFEGLMAKSSNDNLRGDIYGLLLANQLQGSANATPPSVADVLDGFFTAPPSNRDLLKELARTHPDWVTISGKGGQETFHAGHLGWSTYFQSLATSRGKTLFSGLNGTPPILRAFSTWMNREAQQQNPLGDYPSPRGAQIES